MCRTKMLLRPQGEGGLQAYGESIPYRIQFIDSRWNVWY